tara:strand:- start:51 stop:500 length:450 start_codon:yes stop_codon:yes gene_type:complete
MNTEIFLPMFYLMLWTVGVFLFSTTVRLKEIYLHKVLNKKPISPEEHRHPPFTEGSRVLKNTQRNLVNLFEFPIFFYAICIIIFITNNSNELYVTLAYWFLYLRIAHSLYHIFFNHLVFNGGFPLRSIIWIPSTLVLVWLWMLVICSFS